MYTMAMSAQLRFLELVSSRAHASAIFRCLMEMRLGEIEQALDLLIEDDKHWLGVILLREFSAEKPVKAIMGFLN